MKAYLEKILRRPVDLSEFLETDKLPLMYRHSVRLNWLEIDGQRCLIIAPVDVMSMTELRKCHRQIERYTGVRCAFFLRSLTYYAKEQLLSEGIPFIWENHQLYLPFLGMMLNAQDGRQIKPCDQISFMTQKLLLKAIYDGWKGFNVSQTAEALKVSKMTITRCFDEIEALELPILQIKSRARKLYADGDKKELWKMIRPIMRNPVIRTFRLAEPLKADLIYSGISALTQYSMLNDNPYPSFAFEKAQIKELDTKNWKRIPIREQPECVAHEVGYILPFGGQHAVDPLSVALMLTEEEQNDPRVQIAVEEMLEEYVW